VSADFDTRVGAYGVIVRNGSVLLARFVGDGSGLWTLPGGGLEAGEDPPTAAMREIMEETGYQVTLQELLGVDSVHVPRTERHSDKSRALHSLRIIYRASVTSGELRREVGGSTDDARWFDLDAVAGVPRVGLVDTGLGMWRKQIEDLEALAR
jgi:8-oxo-dGTP diphosphatase